MNKLAGWRATWGVYVLVAAAIASQAQTFMTLHSFDYLTDGAYPGASLIQAADGNLYGTTYGGANVDGGTIFKIAPNGALTTVYKLCTAGGLCPQNIGPRAPLLQATSGSFYGATFGVAEQAAIPGAIFEIAGGTVKTLHSFCPQERGCPDGANPAAGLVQAASGDLYGTTEFGGGTCVTLPIGCGTVFKITPSGVLTTLYTFCKHGIEGMCPDGAYPLAGLVQAADGDFYGTTYQGGDHGSGSVFKITPSGRLTTLHIFCTRSGCPDGYEPLAGLVQTSNGDLYGTTSSGGANTHGLIFKITPSGKLTAVHNFCSQNGCTDGATPSGALVEATDGNLYGTTATGGAADKGTLFKITPGGTLTTLYDFCTQNDCTDGAGPAAALFQATDGDLYGTTTEGGTYCVPFGCGTVFRLSVGLAPFVETNPVSGTEGKSVVILGTNLTGATRVTFNGTAATFTVESPTAIKTAVPAGATTGLVQVVVPSGPLTSNVAFRVRP